MRYALRQKIFSLANRFTIKGANGQDVVMVTGKIFSLGHKLWFHDTQGNELAFIKQNCFHGGRRITSTVAATITRRLRKDYSQLLGVDFQLTLMAHLRLRLKAGSCITIIPSREMAK